MPAFICGSTRILSRHYYHSKIKALFSFCKITLHLPPLAPPLKLRRHAVGEGRGGAFMKDYYKILGIPPSASLQEIKKSYRKLAFKYHPDKNPESSLAEAQFKEIQEAYATLSVTGKRSKYDDERWLNGMGSNTQYREAVTPSWLITISRQLNISLITMDTHRISQRALQAYILLIISDAHIGVLQQAGEKEANEIIIQELLNATKKLQLNYLADIFHRLLLIAGGNEAITQTVAENLKGRKTKARQEKLFPYIIILITLALCVFMYLYGSL